MEFADRALGPDRGWSWVVAFACCFSSLILAGIFRTSGVLFVAFIDAFGVTREEASWPMAVCIGVLNLTGPFSGILGQRYGARSIILAGSLVATLGISACYLTTSLEVITILFGGVFGIGYGLMNTLMPGILNVYFLNLRATANGIANSGSCIGSIVLPVVFEHFISNYGLSGCFLLTGGIVLHIAIAASLMRAPPWLKKTNSHSPGNHPLQNPVDRTKCRVSVENPNQKNPDVSVISNCHSLPPAYGRHLDCNRTNSGEIDVAKEHKRHQSHETTENNAKLKENISPKATHNYAITESLDQTKGDLDNQQYHFSLHDNPHLPTYNDQLPKNSSLESQQVLQRSESPYIYKTETDLEARSSCLFCKCCPLDCKCKTPPSLSDISQSFVTVLTCPMFYITAITNVSFYFLYHMYVVIIVDYALDSGVPEDRTKYVLFAFSVADLFGRLCLGWVTDRRLVTRPRFVMGCMAMIGVVFVMFPFARDCWSLVAVSCCYGLLLGCTMVVFPILLVDFLGIELHAVSYGCMCFMNGLASFGRPFLIGYFRDSLGSYSSMFYVLGLLSVAASALWILEKVFNKRKTLM